jgi:hypothetical protein
MYREREALTMIGWREWFALPALGVPAIKAKVDSGARTSALHTFWLETFRRRRRDYVRFAIHPLQRRTDLELRCESLLLDQRVVRDSGGHRERRCVIETTLRAGDTEWPIEMTLTNRESMLFRMLLGRTSMRGRLLVDPGASFRLGRELAQVYNFAAQAHANPSREA